MRCFGGIMFDNHDWRWVWERSCIWAWLQGRSQNAYQVLGTASRMPHKLKSLELGYYGFTCLHYSTFFIQMVDVALYAYNSPTTIPNTQIDENCQCICAQPAGQRKALAFSDKQDSACIDIYLTHAMDKQKVREGCNCFLLTPHLTSILSGCYYRSYRSVFIWYLYMYYVHVETSVQ